MAHIPTGFDEDLNNKSGDKKSHIFDDGATVNFKVYQVSEKIKDRTFDKGKLLVSNCEMWALMLIISDPTDSSKSNLIFCDVVKDGRAWNVLDKNGRKWIQNKFLSLCTGMGLRKHGEQLNLNPAWFTDVNMFTDVTGQLKVTKKISEYGKNEGTWINEVNWFIDKPVQVATQPSIIKPESGATVEVFKTDVANPDDEYIPF